MGYLQTQKFSDQPDHFYKKAQTEGNIGNDLIKKEPPVAMQQESSKNRNRKSMIDCERQSKNKFAAKQNLFGKEVSIEFECKTEFNPNHVLTKKVRDQPVHFLRKVQMEKNVGNGKSNTNFDDVPNRINKKIKNSKRKSVNVRVTQVAKKSLKPYTKNAVKKRINYSCNSCGKTFTTNPGLKQHVNSIHKGMTYVCFLCGKRISTHYKLQNHIQSVHVGKSTHACDSCDKKFATRSYLMEHVRSVHNRDKRVCDICGKSFSSLNGIKEHINAEFNCVRHACHVCGKKYKFRGSIQAHIDSEHRKIAHACDVCGKTYKFKCNLKIHKDFKHRKITYACDTCEKEFPRKSTLNRHIDAAHAGIGHPRDSREQTLKCKSKLKVHTDSSVHNGVTQSSCDICEKTFARKSQLRIHIKTSHNGVKPAPKLGKSNRKKSIDALRNGIPLERDLRAKQFTSKDTRKNRLDAIRKTIGHSCDICEKKFVWKATLKRHIETTHKGHACGTCGKTFKLRIQLLTHNRVKHVCDTTAGKSLLNKSNSKPHVDTALITGVVAYSCNVCVKKFAGEKSVKIHAARMHRGMKSQKENIR